MAVGQGPARSGSARGGGAWPAGGAGGGGAGRGGRGGGGGRGGSGAGGGAGRGGADHRPARPGSRLALRNWRVRWRLLALITIPTLTAMVLGGIRISADVHTAENFQRIEQLATLGGDVTQLAQAMEDERDLTAGFIANGRPPSGQNTLRKQYAVTDSAADLVRTQGAHIGRDYPVDTRDRFSAVLARITDLNGLRNAALRSQLPALPMITDYSQAITDLFAFDDQISVGSANDSLAQHVRALGALGRMKDQVSQQRAILFAALTAGDFEPGELNALTSAQAQQAANLSTYMASTTVRQRQAFADTVTGSAVDQGRNLEQNAIVLGNSNQPLVTGSPAAASQHWYTAMVDTLKRMRSVERQDAGAVIAQSRSLRRGAARTALLTGIAVAGLLVLALIVTAIIARSLIRPLRRLRSGALNVAGLRLPEKVRQLSETGGSGPDLDVAPIDVASTDEVGEVARAFDQVHREALRLAANEAILRGNVNAMFVSLSRRSQSLVERQIRLIDELEQGEQDAERLGNLFRMDHLATRMRRNSENLLVLAGHDPARRWGKPVALVDVLRAAVSEIEQYERATMNIQPGTSVVGNAVNDVVHLLAELLENATSFSPGDTPVKVSGHLLNSGGVLLDITDQGVGMGAEEMAHANWRLENPPVVDVAVSRRMGLFVVARLAARHGIRVRLRQPEFGGLTALVWLPDTLISQERTPPTTWMRRVGALETEPVRASPAEMWNAAPPTMLNAPALPADTWAAPDTGPMRAAGTGPMWAAADTGPAQAGAETGPVRAGAETGPMWPAAETGPMPPMQPTREISPVVVPAGAAHGPESRLPIYDLLESDWFHRRGEPPQRVATGEDVGSVSPAEWISAADEGWRAAHDTAAPSVGPMTAAGLPQRVPQANIVPGTASTRLSAPANPSLSAEAARERMASFQEGVRRARAAIKTENPSDG